MLPLTPMRGGPQGQGEAEKQEEEEEKEDEERQDEDASGCPSYQEKMHHPSAIITQQGISRVVPIMTLVGYPPLWV